MYDINGNYIGKSKLLGVIGDSISSDEVTYLGSNGTAWVKMLADKWHCDLSRVTRSGKTIETGIVDAVNQISSDCDMVIVALGINDAMHGSASMTITEIMDLYKTQIERLKNKLPNKAVIVCVSPIWNYYDDTTDEAHNRLMTVRNVIKTFIKSKGINNGWIYVNGLDVLTHDDYSNGLYYDSTHPNLSGTGKYAGRLYTLLPDINEINN